MIRTSMLVVAAMITVGCSVSSTTKPTSDTFAERQERQEREERERERAAIERARRETTIVESPPAQDRDRDGVVDPAPLAPTPPLTPDNDDAPVLDARQAQNETTTSQERAPSEVSRGTQSSAAQERAAKGTETKGTETKGTETKVRDEDSPGAQARGENDEDERQEAGPAASQRAAQERQKQAARERQEQATRDKQQQATRDKQAQAARDKQAQVARDKQAQAARDKQQQAARGTQTGAAQQMRSPQRPEQARQEAERAEQERIAKQRAAQQERTAQQERAASDRTGDVARAPAPESREAQREPDNTGINERDRDRAAMTSGDQSNKRRDIAITQAIRKMVMKDDALSFNAKNVKIITRNGKVTLRGPVESPNERSTIETSAKKVPGVKQVDNQIEVKGNE